MAAAVLGSNMASFTQGVVRFQGSLYKTVKKYIYFCTEKNTYYVPKKEHFLAKRAHSQEKST